MADPALKKALAKPGVIVAPGVFDLISALVADRMGFKALYVTGYGTVASAMGLPDAGIATYRDMVERIEVISGPGATLWGSNAVNGVINVVTKSSTETQGWLVDAGGGTYQEGFGGARYGGELSPTLHYRVFGKIFQRDDTVFRNGDDGDDDWYQSRGGFRMDWEATDADLVTVAGPDDLLDVLVVVGHRVEVLLPPGLPGDAGDDRPVGQPGAVFRTGKVGCKSACDCGRQLAFAVEDRDGGGTRWQVRALPPYRANRRSVCVLARPVANSCRASWQ